MYRVGRPASRRYKNFPIGDEVLWTLLRGWDGHMFRVEFDAVPEGARLLGVAHDFNSRSFVLQFEHDSFDVVPDGGLPETAEPLAVAISPIPLDVDVVNELRLLRRMVADLQQDSEAYRLGLAEGRRQAEKESQP